MGTAGLDVGPLLGRVSARTFPRLPCYGAPYERAMTLHFTVILKSHSCNFLDQVQVLAHDLGLASCTSKICRTFLLVSEHVTDFDVESILTFETLPYIASGFDSHDDTWCIHNLRQPERAVGTWKWTLHCSIFKTNWQPLARPLRPAELFCGGFAGGAHDVRILNHMKAPILTVAAIDHDLGVAIAYSRTHRAAFINQWAPHGAATSAGITLPYVWHADICNSNWLADYGMTSTNVWQSAFHVPVGVKPSQQGRRNATL